MRVQASSHAYRVLLQRCGGDSQGLFGYVPNLVGGEFLPQLLCFKRQENWRWKGPRRSTFSPFRLGAIQLVDPVIEEGGLATLNESPQNKGKTSWPFTCSGWLGASFT